MRKARQYSRPYVGIRKVNGKPTGERVLFRSVKLPTQHTHGNLYTAVIGPFRTRAGAEYLRDNIWCSTVKVAERNVAFIRYAMSTPIDTK